MTALTTGVRVGPGTPAGSCADPGSDLLNLGFAYGASNINNGNLASQTITADGKTFTQTYDQYDNFNRSTSASEGAIR